MNDWYQRLLALGACGGTRKDIMIPVAKNRVDIDKLPVGKVDGRVLRVEQGVVLLQDESGKLHIIATHPAGVSRIGVTGDMPAEWLKPGMTVRLLGEVDATGHCAVPLRQIDVVSLEPGFQPPGVEPNKVQSIFGVVTSLRSHHLTLKTPAGSIHRLWFLIDDQAIAHVNSHDLAFAAVGDTLTAEGHLYTGEQDTHLVFASDVTVVKPTIEAAP
ncbi:hypothetical protein [Lignipirellula cremea]|nr:hypothetical protein [Lignipirellula cremea]